MWSRVRARLDRRPSYGGLPVAPLRLRARARSLDLATTVAIAIAVRVLVLAPYLADQAGLAGRAASSDARVAQEAARALLADPTFWALWVGTTVAVSTVWHATWELARGATPGKRRTGLRVVDATTGGRLTAQQAWVRAGLRALLALPAGLGLTSVLRDEHNRAWHDRAVGAVVVAEDRSRRQGS